MTYPSRISTSPISAATSIASSSFMRGSSLIVCCLKSSLFFLVQNLDSVYLLKLPPVALDKAGILCKEPISSNFILRFWLLFSYKLLGLVQYALNICYILNYAGYMSVLVVLKLMPHSISRFNNTQTKHLPSAVILLVI